MKICIIGLGYIGLPTAAMFAKAGADTLGVDKNEKIIDALNKGETLVEEEGLQSLVSQMIDEGRLKASLTPDEADVFIITVPTPISQDKKADMAYVVSATESIVPFLKGGNTVILESTSPVGTVHDIMIPILEKSGLKMGEEIFLGHSPERVIPGNILKELVENSRLAGGINEKSSLRIKEIYELFVKGEIFITDARTAELCKTAENTFRDINIAYANELATICESVGVNVWEVIELCNKHPRVNILQPGPGVGGHCIAVDPWFIAEKEPEKSQLIQMSRTINDGMPQYVARDIMKILEGIEDPVVSILGISYKPDVGDTRESPLLHLFDILTGMGVYVRAYDPHASQESILKETLEDAVSESDLLVLGVHHKEFKKLPLEKLAGLMRNKNIFDTRNYIDKEEALASGFNYYLLGQGEA